MFGFRAAAGFISPFKDADGSSYTTPDAAISVLLDILGAEENLIVDLGMDGRRASGRAAKSARHRARFIARRRIARRGNTFIT